MFVYLLVLRREVKVQSGKAPRKSLLEMIGTMLVLLTVGFLLARRLRAGSGRRRPSRKRPSAARARSRSTRTTQPTATPTRPSVAWVPVLVTIGLILLAVVAWWYAGRARKRARGELHSGLAEAVAQASTSRWTTSAPSPIRAAR